MNFLKLLPPLSSNQTLVKPKFTSCLKRRDFTLPFFQDSPAACVPVLILSCLLLNTYLVMILCLAHPEFSFPFYPHSQLADLGESPPSWDEGRHRRPGWGDTGPFTAVSLPPPTPSCSLNMPQSQTFERVVLPCYLCSLFPFIFPCRELWQQLTSLYWNCSNRGHIRPPHHSLCVNCSRQKPSVRSLSLYSWMEVHPWKKLKRSTQCVCVCGGGWGALLRCRPGPSLELSQSPCLGFLIREAIMYECSTVYARCSCGQLPSTNSCKSSHVQNVDTDHMSPVACLL